MNFEKLLELSETQSKFAQRMVDMGSSEASALEAATKTTVVGLPQVCKDLVRMPSIEVILDSQPVGSPDRYIDVDNVDFNDEASVENFISLLASNDPFLTSYIGAYLHQGGFQNTAETLLTYFFRFDNPDNQLLANTENRRNRFIIHPDGSLTFEECFDIDKIKLINENEYKPDNGPIATVKLRSKIHLVMNEQGEPEIRHDFEDIKVKCRDKAAKKLFNDPRNPFLKFVDWAKDIIKSIFSQAVRERNQQLRQIPPSRLKL